MAAQILRGFSIISIHTPREGCDRIQHIDHRDVHISIHAPREGCDPVCETGGRQEKISIHAPREGCDYSGV